MRRLLDILFSLLGIVLLSPIMLLLALSGFVDTGSPIFRQVRVGRGQRPFVLVKFRTMRVSAPSVVSHLADPAVITAYGKFLRRTKLDELPQLWNVLIGDMSIVGPRPGLFNHEELIRERASRGVYRVRPGITGLAQVNAIDMSTPRQLAETDQRMIETMTLGRYFRYIFMTLAGRGAGDRVGTREN